MRQFGIGLQTSMPRGSTATTSWLEYFTSFTVLDRDESIREQRFPRSCSVIPPKIEKEIFQ